MLDGRSKPADVIFFCSFRSGHPRQAFRWAWSIICSLASDPRSLRTDDHFSSTLRDYSCKPNHSSLIKGRLSNRKDMASQPSAHPSRCKFEYFAFAIQPIYLVRIQSSEISAEIAGHSLPWFDAAFGFNNGGILIFPLEPILGCPILGCKV